VGRADGFVRAFFMAGPISGFQRTAWILEPTKMGKPSAADGRLDLGGDGGCNGAENTTFGLEVVFYL
jgi:hypothetical protein